MIRKTLVAALVATSLLAGMIGGLGVAAAASASVLTVTPVEPKVADVCWTRYDPAPEPGTVTNYRLTAPELLDIPITAAPDAFRFVNGRYCVLFSNLLSGKRYTFSLEAQIDDYAFTEAAPQLVAHYFALSASLSRTHVNAGQVVTVSGTLKTGNQGQAHARVIVQKRSLTSDTWRQVGVVTTDSQGGYTRSFKVRSNTKVRTYFKGVSGGDATVGAWNSNNQIDASPVFSLSFAKNPVRVGQRVRASGSVTAGSVQLLAGDPVCLQQQQGRSWRSLKCVPISPRGRFSYPLTPKTRADLKYRWKATSVAPEYVAGYSRRHRLVVR